MLTNNAMRLRKLYRALRIEGAPRALALEIVGSVATGLTHELDPDALRRFRNASARARHVDAREAMTNVVNERNARAETADQIEKRKIVRHARDEGLYDDAREYFMREWLGNAGMSADEIAKVRKWGSHKNSMQQYVLQQARLAWNYRKGIFLTIWMRAKGVPV